MALALHSILNDNVNSAAVSFGNTAIDEPFVGKNTHSLARESFVGELAMLRQQVQNQSTQPFSSQFSPKITPKSSSQNLAQQKALADQLIDVMPTGLVMLDGNGIVVKINKVAKQLLDEPILGQPWFTVIARSFKPRKDDWHEVSLKDGRRVKLEITSLGAQPGQLIMITDLTETRLLQDKLGQLQRLSSLGRMISTLAHQIRTPLSAAMLYSANLTNSKLNEKSRHNFQEKLNSRLQDLEQQVNDMLLFSKSGKEQVVSPLSVNEMITDSVHAMDALTHKANAKVNVQLCETDCQILANKHALMGAVQNLIHNSLQAMPEQQQAAIHIQVYCQDDFAYISLKDNGQGIDKTIEKKIFDPFYTSSSNGTGLGLAVVKSVVKAHQGEVKLLSKTGEGAHFCLKLPLLMKSKNEQPISQLKESGNDES
ncbi:MAG: ATP-binding protein [Colwellia sp.]